ncbi:class I SAM-dependent methyltransferase [bacterium]|nr:class I SAM-dependent methyltransferase [bacterium]
MTDRQASRTAVGVAYLRAAHQIFDACPLILDDPLALRLLGEGTESKIRSTPERFQTPENIALRSHVVLRSRFAEDCLQESVARGVTRYVLLGAGFDTFALRQPEWAKGLQILEVDHAGTQAEKRAHLDAAGLAIPPNVSFIQIDFAHESLLEGLRRQGVQPDAPAFFSWLGVCMYLERAAIESTLRSVAAFPPGSRIVLTFLPPEARAQLSFSQLGVHVAGLGEPFVSFFTRDEMQALLEGAGFSRVEFLTPEAARERYYDCRPADLPPPARSGIVSAIR